MQLRLVIHCFVLLQQQQIVCLHLTMVRSTIAHSTLLLPKYCYPTPTCPLLYPDLPTPHPVYTPCHLLYTPPPLIPNTTTLPNPQYQNVSKSIAHSAVGTRLIDLHVNVQMYCACANVINQKPYNFVVPQCHCMV